MYIIQLLQTSKDRLLPQIKEHVPPAQVKTLFHKLSNLPLFNVVKMHVESLSINVNHNVFIVSLICHGYLVKWDWNVHELKANCGGPKSEVYFPLHMWEVHV